MPASVYIDALTVLLAVAVLFTYIRWVVVNANKINILGLFATCLYLLAQTDWTSAYLTGDVWGRDFSNYIWFLFNTSVFTILILVWLDSNKR